MRAGRSGKTLLTCRPKTSIYAASTQVSFILRNISVQMVRYFMSNEDKAVKF